jgi:hypothetical protein
MEERVVAPSVCVDLAIKENFVENVSLLLCILTFTDILLQNNLWVQPF